MPCFRHVIAFFSGSVHTETFSNKLLDLLEKNDELCYLGGLVVEVRYVARRDFL